MRSGKKRIRIVLAAVAALIMGWSPAVHALVEDTVRPSPAAQGDPDFRPRLGTYYYCFEFKGMSIGSACIDIQREGDLYRMQVSARTTEKIDYVYKIRYQGQSLTDMDPLSPRETRISQKVKSKEKDIVIRFQGDGSIHTSEKVVRKGGPEDDELRRINPGRFTVDPFSATYLARGYEWKTGSEQTFDVYTGKSRYELKLKCIDRVLVDVQGSRRDAWVIVPSARALDPDKKPQDGKKKPADVKIYLSADDRRDVLKVEASHTMGTFLVSLDRFEPAGNLVKAAQAD
ncbi:MAG TPA: DUF3108 domain-containing protein [Deltaproteobacteria bacterium]|jgi:hypothetical protein|nr:DUF3108 domain-containing protein [Deltaproteobacteria bacterium]HOI06129.1 DUF3108 domain-containing protein [Deltaproteobacteria bacterium]